jgi:hypothetical protein
MFSEYRRSLKMPEAEEFFDLYFYRPVAFIFVRLIGWTRITPNQITLISMLFALVAAWFYSSGKQDFFILAGMIYAAANVLDCADGQLARLQNSGTLFGRVIDGVADYISSVAIFLGIGLSLSASTNYPWLLTIAAGLSSAVHAMIFDHYQSEFISTVRSERNFLERETEQFTSEISRMRRGGENDLKILVLSIYVRYLRIQRSSSTRRHHENIDPGLYRKENLLLIRFWSFLGPTTNRTGLIICSLFGRLDLYLWCVVIAGNIWLVGCYLLQKKVHDRLVAHAGRGS